MACGIAGTPPDEAGLGQHIRGCFDSLGAVEVAVHDAVGGLSPQPSDVLLRLTKVLKEIVHGELKLLPSTDVRGLGARLLGWRCARGRGLALLPGAKAHQ